MARLESASEFSALLEQGKYESAVNAQRAAGRTRLSEGEKKKCFAAIERHFEVRIGAAPTKKVAAKKVARKAAERVARRSEPVSAAAAPSPGKNVGRGRLAKKVSRRGRGAPSAEAAAIDAAEAATTASSVLEILRVIDGTVTSSNGIMEALERASKLGTGDIDDGVAKVKEALTAAAKLLHESVVTPLSFAGPQSDPEVSRRLEAVIATAPTVLSSSLPSTMDGAAYSAVPS